MSDQKDANDVVVTILDEGVVVDDNTLGDHIGVGLVETESQVRVIIHGMGYVVYLVPFTANALVKALTLAYKKFTDDDLKSGV